MHRDFATWEGQYRCQWKIFRALRVTNQGGAALKDEIQSAQLQISTKVYAMIIFSIKIGSLPAAIFRIPVIHSFVRDCFDIIAYFSPEALVVFLFSPG